MIFSAHKKTGLGPSPVPCPATRRVTKSPKSNKPKTISNTRSTIITIRLIAEPIVYNLSTAQTAVIQQTDLENDLKVKLKSSTAENVILKKKF